LTAAAVAAVAVMEVATEEVLAAAAVGEAEAIVAAAAARILVGSGVAVASVAIPAFLGVDQASAATGSPRAGGVTYAALPAAPRAALPWSVLPPVPPPVPPPFGLSTPQQQGAAAAWVAQQQPARAPAYGTPADRAYQVRVAGSPERFARGAAPGTGVWADGYRPADGALIDAKNVHKRGCSPRTLDGLSEGSNDSRHAAVASTPRSGAGRASTTATQTWHVCNKSRVSQLGGGCGAGQGVVPQ
jgi:hypothetical protein